MPLLHSARLLARLSAILLLAAPLPLFAQRDRMLSLLPQPRSVIIDSGAPFALRNPVRIEVAATDSAYREVAEFLAEVLRARTGFTVQVAPSVPASARAPRAPRATGVAPARRATRAPRAASIIVIGGGLPADASLGADERYTLAADVSGIRIRAVSPRGALWGVQTLRQLLPIEFDALNGAPRATWSIAAVRIDDTPRFVWRGTMLDVSRHFLPLAAVKRHLDLMSRYKLNVLHWHLTDDQGWRIEIAKYPELTRVGAWRTETDGRRTGGFYTQPEIREVVEYARRRGIMVIPEIEMPGHEMAALAAYPELGCTGEQFTVPTTWGVFADVLCPGKSFTFTFVQDVLDEVIPLFPAPFVHIGGDEVPKDRWRDCASCQAIIQREGLANEDELQRWFTDSIGRFLATRGRRLIGWNEIMHGGRLLPSTVVQSWEDSSWTRRGIEAGHEVIASPNEWTYLDASPRDRPLAKIYAFEPVPPGATPEQARRVLGGEVPLWSERITSPANLEFMAWPRALAFAEVMWSDAPRDLRRLTARLTNDHLLRLRGMGVAVGPADVELVRLGVAFDGVARVPRVQVTAGAPGIVLRMTADGSTPSAASPEVTSGTPLTGEGVRRLQAFYGEQTVREELRVELVRHLGVGAHVTATPPANPQYLSTGRDALADGLIGSIEHGDGMWQGWWGPDVRLELVLDSAVNAREISIRFMQKIGAWIALPGAVEFSWSTDGITWSPKSIRQHAVPVLQGGARIETFSVELPSPTAIRFVRISARSSGPLPASHPGAGRPSWLFADEVVIR